MPATPPSLEALDRDPMPVVTRATDYPAGHQIAEHRHARHQLVFAVHGVLLVAAAGGRWIVPSTRAIWMPAGLPHTVRAIGAAQMRSVYVRPDAAPGLPLAPQVVGVSPLLRELVRAAMDVPRPYDADSRDGRLMRLLLDELHALPVLPLHLPEPADPRLRPLCARLLAQPDDPSTLEDWGAALGVAPRTLQRLFARETGMTFGQWRQQARLQRALERLALGDKVIDVALALGYDSPSAFASMFRRQFGVAPAAFYK